MTTTSTSPAVTKLAAELRDTLQESTVLTPDSDGYSESIKRWSDAVEKKAGIVVYVRSAEDISATILACRKHSVSFVVSGGRHSSSGAGSSEGGLVIDLAKMREVHVDSTTNLVRVQGGCIWKDVDDAAFDSGLAAVGGTVNHTGVAGLTLGGGYGWLSGRYGLVIDNLRAVQMVLADGTITTASEENQPDLFWAVRGAGHAFGVAVEFTFQAHEQKNPVWAGQMAFPIDKLHAIITFANSLVSTTDGDSGLIMGITAPPFTNHKPAVITNVFHNGPTTEALSIFQPLLDLQPIINSTKERPYNEVNGMMNHAVDYGGRKLSKSAVFQTPLRPEFVSDIILPELERFHATVPGGTRSIFLFEFFKSDRWCEYSTADMSFANRGPHQNVMVGPFWDRAEDDQAARNWSQAVSELAWLEIERNQIDNGPAAKPAPTTEYGNYDHLAASPRRIFGANLERLIELKQQYDPQNVFDKSYSLIRGGEDVGRAAIGVCQHQL
ncbi:hypothetical protein ABOM_003993 [Aspergillus bombycis]|uniref:FAD-binding PCMH-type domain-containing protein n=1 Tax=Aspergillus bombycis TaxID=109264 RepID=A0A1F8A751_9EURO|nr:hypothetical protein ABOM_003993 [Aspergillus bombycis]OGM47239.1 hypothetical protein ABOM_003993 [Aspergillus bombycis]